MQIPTLAAELPHPMRCECFETLEGAYCSRTPMLRQAIPVTGGASTEIPAILNRNARLTELIAKYGSCDMFAVSEGLNLVEGEGLSASISPGHAFGETLLEAPRAIQISLWDDAQNFVWLKNDGTPQIVNGSTTPPEGGGVYLGCIMVEKGIQASISHLGRFELRAGNVVRRTLDVGKPEDNPQADPSWFYTVTLGGIYLWDGEAYWKVGQSA